MLVAAPGQTATYSTLHNSSANGGGSNNSTATSSTMKKSSTSSTTSGTAKPLNSNNNHTTSTITTKSSLNLNTNSTTHSYHSNTKNDNIVLSKISNQNKSSATSSREIILSSKQAATTHSENATKTTNTTNTKHQSFIQTLKDSVQKALITTTGSSSNSISTATKHLIDNKLQNNCNNAKSSFNNVTSSSSSTTHNANKVSTTNSSNTSNNSTAATQSSSSSSVVRGKYFSCSLSKLHTVAPTIIHRYPEERQHASSTDSLHKEMCHFKPIRIVAKTPWKSGSKSRGNSLRFPKPKLATKKLDFVLKSNCDVNNRKKKQQIDKIIVAADEDDDNDNEQENKQFHRIYKPKPSLTCLSTSNHTSAFVCLIEGMHSLVNLQEIPKAGSKSAKQEISKTNAKLSNISKVSTVAIRKAKSSRNAGRAKSKTIDLLTLAIAKEKDKLHNSVSTPAIGTAAALTKKGTRKRKIAHNDNNSSHQELISTLSISPLPTKSASNKSVLLASRKSSRLSSMGISGTSNKNFKNFPKQSNPKTTIKPTTVVRFSPPMTRSRLKILKEQGKDIEAAVKMIKKRKI